MKANAFLISLMLVGGSALGQEYPQQITISRSVAVGTVSDQKAVETIVASNGVSRGSTALYTAGKSVTLQPGFVALAGSVFEATVAPVVSLRSVGDFPDLSLRAYPNPFSVQTTVEYTVLASDRSVRHTLMDVKGQVLRQFEEITGQATGRHQTQVDGGDLPMGIYFYKLEVGTESRTLRLLKKE